MSRGHTPFGYRIMDGRVVICEDEVRKIKEIYSGYLSGLSYAAVAQRVGLKMNHGSVKRLMQNRHYLGDEFYPAIIDQELFDAAETERRRRSTKLGRDNRKKTFFECSPVPTEFMMNNEESRVFAEPFAQAEYLYSLIKVREV